MTLPWPPYFRPPTWGHRVALPALAGLVWLHLALGPTGYREVDELLTELRAGLRAGEGPGSLRVHGGVAAPGAGGHVPVEETILPSTQPAPTWNFAWMWMRPSEHGSFGSFWK